MLLMVVVAGKVEPVGQDRDGPDPGQVEPAGDVEVVGGVAAEPGRLVDGDRGGHELGRVQAQHGRPGGPGPFQAGSEQRPPDPQPPDPGLDPEGPQPGPAGRPAQLLPACVGIEGDRAHDPAAVLGDQHLPGPDPGLDVEDVGQVAPEHGRRQRRRVLLVGRQQHTPNGRQVGRPGITDLDPGEMKR